jgi:hypothetical protein
MFARGTYLYDKALVDKFDSGTKTYQHFANYGRLLDAYAFGKFDIFGRSLFVRAGNQVVSWGEGTSFGTGSTS